MGPEIESLCDSAIFAILHAAGHFKRRRKNKLGATTTEYARNLRRKAALCLKQRTDNGVPMEAFHKLQESCPEIVTSFKLVMRNTSQECYTFNTVAPSDSHLTIILNIHLKGVT